MKISARYLFNLCVAATSLVAASAFAQDFRVGFDNTDRIFREANTAKAAQSKLETEFSKREKEVVLQMWKLVKHS